MFDKSDIFKGQRTLKPFEDLTRSFDGFVLENVTLRTKAIVIPFEIPLRLTPCAFAHLLTLHLAKVRRGYALAQDDTLTGNSAQDDRQELAHSRTLS